MTKEQDDREAKLERMLATTTAISTMIECEEDESARAAMVTEVVATWLGGHSEEEQPEMLAFLTGGALQALGHDVTTMVEKDGKRTTVTEAEGAVTATEEARHHAVGASEETRAALDLVIQKARDLHLHGVVILSPVCDGCGHLHDFAMVSDMGYGEGKNLSKLLRDFAEAADGRGHMERLREIEGGTIQ